MCQPEPLKGGLLPDVAVLLRIALSPGDQDGSGLHSSQWITFADVGQQAAGKGAVIKTCHLDLAQIERQVIPSQQGWHGLYEW